MSRKEYITEPQFDHHAEAIDGPAQAWSDPEISRMDRMDYRPWVRDAVAAHKWHPQPATGAVTVLAPVTPLRTRRSPSKRAWATGALILVLVVLTWFAGVAMFSMAAQ